MLLSTTLKVPIITPRGRLIDIRQYRNTPFSVFFPHSPVTIIQWVLEGEKKPVARVASGERIALADPVRYKGIAYNGSWAWGSSVKKGQTFGLTQDIGWDTGMFRYVEDGQRFQRWLMCQGWYGLSRRPLRIKLETPSTMTKHGLVEDGFGYITRQAAELSHREPIKLGASRGSYTFWQRVPWSQGLADELSPAIIERILNISSVNMLGDMHHSYEAKLRLVDLSEDMAEHPFVALSIEKQWAQYLSHVATTVPTGSYYRLAVPTECPTVESGDPGNHLVIARYPIDNFGSIQAVEPVYSTRIAEMEVIQYSISSLDVFFKGCAQLVDDLDGYDAVLCTEDVKMAVQGVKAVAFDGVYEGDVVVSVNQRYAPGSCIGVNAKWAKDLMGLDHDGDMVEVHPCDGLPRLYEAVQGLPTGETPKLPKSKRRLDQGDYRPEMIVQNLQDVVGFATNVSSECLGYANQEALATVLGYDSAELLHNRLNYAIKVGTDGFKANVDPTFVLQYLTSIQAKTKDIGRLAPWTSWPGEEAFVHYIPRVYDKAWADEDGRCFGKVTIDGQEIVSELTLDEFENCVHSIHTGTISQIARLVLPHLDNLLTVAIKTQPLTYFRRWGEKQPEAVIESVKAIRDWWNIHYARCNWSAPDEIKQLKLSLQEEIDTLLEREEISRWQAANGLWIVAHSARGVDNSAAVAFFAFPEECEAIIKVRPGLDDTFTTILTGVDYQIPGFAAGRVACDVVDVVINKNGRMITRKALVGQISATQKQPGPAYPRDMIGMIALNADQPEVGKYHAVIKKMSDAAWACALVPA